MKLSANEKRGPKGRVKINSYTSIIAFSLPKSGHARRFYISSALSYLREIEALAPLDKKFPKREITPPHTFSGAELLS